ncbi:MAG: hypothetical protein JRH20_25325 [Deltaproteobacteria bacterium]|nr:hypothetical protein [Deltaproteobacteria bacterium]
MRLYTPLPLVLGLLLAGPPAMAAPIDGVVLKELAGILKAAGSYSESATSAEKESLRYVQEAGLPDAKTLARTLEQAVTQQHYTDGSAARPTPDGLWVRKAIQNLAAARLILESKGYARLGINNSIGSNTGVVLGGYTPKTGETSLKVSVKASKTGPVMVLQTRFTHPVVVPLSTPSWCPSQRDEPQRVAH